MALDKLVDSTALDAALGYTADRIRLKTGGSAELPFDIAAGKGFGDAVDAIQSGGSLPSNMVAKIVNVPNTVQSSKIVTFSFGEAYSKQDLPSFRIFFMPISAHVFGTSEMVGIIASNGTLFGSYAQFCLCMNSSTSMLSRGSSDKLSDSSMSAGASQGQMRYKYGNVTISVTTSYRLVAGDWLIIATWEEDE